jgi:hypothetical protein
VLQAGGDKAAYETAAFEFHEGFDARLSKALVCATELDKAARKLLIKIVGVED